MTLPERKALPHEIPWWVTQGARHFITINALERGGQPFLATARSENVALPRAGQTCEAGRAGLSEHAAEDIVARPIANALLDSLLFYESIGKWYLWTAVVMPDHMHFIATFNLERGIGSTLIAWKRYQAKKYLIEFQRDYFEHRLRNDDEFVEKAAYIRDNPVRKGLVQMPDEWPFYWHR